MYILGISGGFEQFNHNPAAVLLKNGKIIAGGEEERFLRIKQAAGYMPQKAISFCLKKANITLRDIDVVAYNNSSYEYMRKRIKGFLELHFGYSPRIELVNHHKCHVNSAFYPSGFKESMILSTDYSGDGESTTLSHGTSEGITKIKSFDKHNSMGIFYALITNFLGFMIDSDEYKVMGLSSYGKPNYDLSRILKITEGNYELIQEMFRHSHPGEKYTYVSRQERRFTDKFCEVLGKPRLSSEPITQRHKDIAASAQRHIEQIALSLIKFLHEKTGSKNLSIAGGVGLNCVMNSKLLQSPYVDKIYIQPSADDAGCALGAAFEMAKTNGFQIEKMDHPYFGPDFSAEEIEAELKSLKVKYEERDDIEAYMAEKVAKGNVIGWFQGRMELGPRALGNRSIIADPRDSKMKEKVNMLIKFREPFRPFAPSVLLERADEYFENVCESPFMNIVFNVKKPKEIPAVTHEDNTSRIHTVRQDVNPKYHKLIKSFSDITSVPVVMNTSFNVKGQPIICTPQQAVSTFFGTGMSTLAIGNFLVEKRDQ